MPRDYAQALKGLSELYASRSPRSAALQESARRVMVDGGSHGLRLMQPFPPRIVRAKGAYVYDEDGHEILDYWQGHFANILGHNPEVVTAALAEAFLSGAGLQTGFTDRLQVEVAEILCRQVGAERVRFTTSGSLATMYAIMLARTFTGRSLVMKVGGGWHGAQPWGMVGVGYQSENGFAHADSAGLPAAILEQTIMTRFNDPQMLADHFSSLGDRLACFIVEPYVGAGGGIPAQRAYLQLARSLSEKHGVVLILDEVISGFRFRAGDLGQLYDIRPDLATFGKIMGGGMPMTAVAGRADILRLAGREGGNRVKFSGGTYSAHPGTLLAVRSLLRYLVEHEADIYPRLAAMGARTRQAIEQAFAQEGIYACCTQYNAEGLAGGSLACLHFPYEVGKQIQAPDEALNPAVCDHVLSEQVLQLALLVHDVHITHGLGSVSTAHTDEDLLRLQHACQAAAHYLRPYVN